MKKLIILFIFFYNIQLFSQSEGDKHRNNGNLEKAIIAYNLDLIKKPNDYTLNYNLACVYAIMYQKDSAFYYLDKSLKNSNSLWALADNDLFALTNDKRWVQIENQQLKKHTTI